MKIILKILIIALVIITAIGIITMTVAKTKCDMICDYEGALTNKLIPGGGLLTIKNDVCVCYFADNVKAFKLGEYGNKRIS